MSAAMLRRGKFAVMLFAAGLLARDAGAADPVPYNVQFTPSGDAELDGLLKQTASLVTLQKKLPAAPFALIGRARADQAQFLIVLHSLGYDAGQVAMSIDGRRLDDPNLLDTLNQAPANVPVVVQVTPDKGALFHLGDVGFTTLPPGVKPPPLRSGDVARAAPILAAGPALLTTLHNAGYAFATVGQPLAVARLKSATLNVTFVVTPGDRVDIGAIEFAGLNRTDPNWLRRHIKLRPGQRFSDTGIFAARDSLLSTGVFSSVTPVPQKTASPEAGVPILFRVVEQKRHAVTLGGSYATDTGFTISSSWEDRNVFGHAETLTFSAAANGLGGTGTTSPGYDLKGVFAKPDYYHVGQTATLTVEGLKDSVTAYNRTALLAQGLLSRPLTPHITFSYGLGFVEESVTQEGINRNYVLLQVPLTLSYDTANSPLEPTKGINASLSLTPTKPVQGGASVFTIAQAYAATYIAVEHDAYGVIALRGQISSIIAASQFQVPADQRFYAGGTSTVRGYTYQTVGPLFADDIPEGGLGLDAGSIEFRQHITKTIGIVPFVDAGQVDAGSAPFKGTLSVGAGLGLRYYTGIGPIRVDFALPLKRTAGSGAFALYIGLGEAF
jgi:translocation and assembly module TamA